MHAVMLDLKGLELSQEEKELLKHPQVGGIILFARNFASIEQLENLLQQIRQLKLAHLLVAVDHEGGRVQRFKQDFTPLPALGKIGELYQTQPEQAKQLADLHGWLMAIELRAVNIDFSFAPVLDLNKNISQVIGDRALGVDPTVISVLGGIYIKGMQRAGMASVGKHFPGHGSVAADSHFDIPVDPRAYGIIASEDLFPFVHLVKEGLTGIMPAHVIYSAVDEKPAGFSELWLQTVLRDQLKFNGAIFSDDLSMQGASAIGDMPTRARVAFAAGCDMVLVCNDRAGAINVIEQLERDGFKSSAASLQRLQNMRGRNAITRADLINMPEWHAAVNALQILN
jgi:beta-N-acetylhexosaminidase